MEPEVTLEDPQITQHVEPVDQVEPEAKTEEQLSTSTEAPETTYEVKVDGEVLKVPLKELLAGYSRTQDYTRKSQDLAELKRKAEYAERLMADPRFQTKPTDPLLSAKEQAKQKILSKWKDVNPEFLDAIFDAQAELAGLKAQESISPFQTQQGEQFERDFLKSHPDVQSGTSQYREIAELIGRGVDPEKAYGLVYNDILVQKKIEEAIKTRDEDAKRKLKQSKTTPATSKSGSSKTFDEAFDKRWAELNS